MHGEHRGRENAGDPKTNRDRPQTYDSRYSHHERQDYRQSVSYSGDRAAQISHGVDSIDVLKIMVRQWRIMLLSVLIGLLIGILYTRTADRIYEAEAVLEMSVRRPKVIASEAVIEDMGSARDSDAIFNTRFEKFRSPAMERLATQEFYKRYPHRRSPENPDSIDPEHLAALIQDVEWSKDSDANIVRVAYQSPYAIFASQLVNVLASCAGQLMIDENRAQSDEAVKWLTSQVDEQRDELEVIERELVEMRNEVQIDALQQRRDSLVNSIASLSEERDTLSSKLTAQKTAYEFISGIQNEDSNLELLPVGLPKGAQLNELIKQWREAHDEFQLAAGRYTALHPDYRLAKEKEDRARMRLQGFVDFTIKEVLNEILLLEKQIEQLDDHIGDLKNESLSLEQSYTAGMQRLQRLERARDAADTSYQTLLQRREEARRAADENMAYTKVIREADVPVKPVRPRKILALLISLILCGAVGLSASVISELWMDKLNSVADLRAMKLNILGIVPSLKKVDSRGELATIGLRDKFHPMVEIFSGINAMLSSGKYSEYSHVLLICSLMPGEGKTVSACNLATSAAMNGSKTLLIDGDLRRPQLINIFAVDAERPSLLEWIAEENHSCEIDDLLTRDVVENLDIITSRPCKDVNPAERLGRGHLNELLNWARERYDRIIIDSPPFGPVSDAQVWGNCADAIVIVSRIGKTRRRALRHAISRFEDARFPLLGCIVNDVPRSLEGMFGGAYGYGYGYGNSYKSSGYHAR